jgi:DNA end-binding protein Ku
MPSANPVWKGFIRFWAVSVRVKAFAAAAPDAGRVKLRLLHAGCNTPIHYARHCPVHGDVPPSEIVRGYQAEADRFVVLDRDDLDAIRPPVDRTVEIQGVIDPAELPPRYYSGKSYYLTPADAAAQRPYGLLRDVLSDCGRAGYAQATLRGRERLVLVRPEGRLLTMSVLLYEQQVLSPQEFEEQVVDTEASAEELALGRTLAERIAVPVSHLAGYRDTYMQRLAALVEATARGETMAAGMEGDGAGPAPPSLIEALHRSIELAGGASKPPKLSAPAGSDRNTSGEHSGATEAGGA